MIDAHVTLMFCFLINSWKSSTYITINMMYVKLNKSQNSCLYSGNHTLHNFPLFSSISNNSSQKKYKKKF